MTFKASFSFLHQNSNADRITDLSCYVLHSDSAEVKNILNDFILICYFRFLHLYQTHLHHELTWRHSTPQSAGWTRVCSSTFSWEEVRERLDVFGFFCRHWLGSSGAQGRWLWERHSGRLQLRQWNPLPKWQNQPVPFWDGGADDCLVSRAQE